MTDKQYRFTEPVIARNAVLVRRSGIEQPHRELHLPEQGGRVDADMPTFVTVAEDDRGGG